ncbi:hypothetical protein TNCV_2500611 [Trichonephila clavipes]|nr:hypothetical protein TNCV_2500611 [Trichonephila clavipes]
MQQPILLEKEKVYEKLYANFRSANIFMPEIYFIGNSWGDRTLKVYFLRRYIYIEGRVFPKTLGLHPTINNGIRRSNHYNIPDFEQHSPVKITGVASPVAKFLVGSFFGKEIKDIYVESVVESLSN